MSAPSLHRESTNSLIYIYIYVCLLDSKRSLQEQNHPLHLLCKKKYASKNEKHFPKMLRDVGMAVPKTTETRCRDGSGQARQVIKRLHKQPHPYIIFINVLEVLL